MLRYNNRSVQERRHEKSSLTKFTKVLDKAASHLESFELIDFIGKHKGLFKVYEYFFPESVKVIEVEVPQEPQSLQEHDAKNEGNVVYVNFDKK
jgi:hypothetical protein